MRGFSQLLLTFLNLKNVPTQRQQCISSNRPLVSSTTTTTRLDLLPSLLSNNQESLSLKRNENLVDLLQAISNVGQVGSLASEDDNAQLEALAQAVIPFSESKKPAKYPLEGEHRLRYSAAPGASSGRLFGNLVGRVTQYFEDGEIFYNRVNFGPIRIALKAKREVKNDTIIKVSFLETELSLFGKTLVQKQAGGGGVWKVKFVGKVKDEQGMEKLIRIMETPSLFVLEQRLN